MARRGGVADFCGPDFDGVDGFFIFSRVVLHLDLLVVFLLLRELELLEQFSSVPEFSKISVLETAALVRVLQDRGYGAEVWVELVDLGQLLQVI